MFRKNSATNDCQIYLASSSQRRRELLQQIGVKFSVLSVSVVEQSQAAESAENYVRRVALEKAQAGWNCPERMLALPVLGADTEVVIDGEILSKPRNRAHGIAMLARLSERSHQVLSAIALAYDGRAACRLVETTVEFREITQVECEDYWASGEPMDKAGGYAIQGRAAVFVKKITGSYSSVVGLPLFETDQLLKEFSNL